MRTARLLMGWEGAVERGAVPWDGAINGSVMMSLPVIGVV